MIQNNISRQFSKNPRYKKFREEFPEGTLVNLYSGLDGKVYLTGTIEEYLADKPEVLIRSGFFGGTLDTYKVNDFYKNDLEHTVEKVKEFSFSGLLSAIFASKD